MYRPEYAAYYFALYIMNEDLCFYMKLVICKSAYPIYNIQYISMILILSLYSWTSCAQGSILNQRESRKRIYKLYIYIVYNMYIPIRIAFANWICDSCFRFWKCGEKSLIWSTNMAFSTHYPTARTILHVEKQRVACLSDFRYLIFFTI